MPGQDFSMIECLRLSGPRNKYSTVMIIVNEQKWVRVTRLSMQMFNLWDVIALP
jgi:hypothetical protein